MSWLARLRGWPVLRGVLPVRRATLTRDLLAGVTLAALGIPEVLGYARIAGMPVVTGLYTLLLPLAVFAVLGASRHLVVAADSATAALLAGALVRLAAPQSAAYVGLAGLVALLTGGLLLLARLARLGFLANFLSRTVLLGFLTGVGIQVAIGQLPDMLGVTAASPHTVIKLAETVAAVPRAHPATVAVSLGVIAVVMAAKMFTRWVPGALLAVAGAIVVSRTVHLAAHGVTVLGPVPRGLPGFTLPTLQLHDAVALLGTAASIGIVILAQSAATARAYAVKHDEPMDTDTDLTGLGAANVAAAFTGTFVVNGSPTKTQIVDDAGGRSQLASLTTGAIAVVVLLVATGPLRYLPDAALAAVVFLIGAAAGGRARAAPPPRGPARRVRRRGGHRGRRDRAERAVRHRGGHRRVDHRPPAAQLPAAQLRAGQVGRRALDDRPGRARRADRARAGRVPVRHQPVLRQREPVRGGRDHADQAW